MLAMIKPWSRVAIERETTKGSRKLGKKETIRMVKR